MKLYIPTDPFGEGWSNYPGGGFAFWFLWLCIFISLCAIMWMFVG